MIDARLLQLASPALPVGAYSYSQGLEAAAESDIVRDVASTSRWIGEVLELSVASMEAPVLARLIDAWQRGDIEGVRRWNLEFIASRETSELRAETVQMGYSLRRLLRDLDLPIAQLDAIDEVAYPTAFACAAAAWKLAAADAIATYVFAWIENQVLAAVKCVPLGQTDGQRLMLELGGRIAALVERAIAMDDDDLANFAPGLAIASARHETQYSRIFRS
jgi:urease accessory protein